MVTDDAASRRIRRLVEDAGGRFSTELGLDLDRSETDVERWFLAATLFAAPIQATVAMRTWHVLGEAGVRTITDAGERSWNDLVSLLDAGGYARYDLRTATRLHQLAETITRDHAGRITSLATETDPARVVSALRALPGWGPTTTAIFLRELRGVWPGADPAVDRRAIEAARRLRLPLGRVAERYWSRLLEHAARAAVDARDLEAALIRRSLRARR